MSATERWKWKKNIFWKADADSWLVGRLVGLPVGWLVDWLAGWLNRLSVNYALSYAFYGEFEKGENDSYKSMDVRQEIGDVRASKGIRLGISKGPEMIPLKERWPIVLRLRGCFPSEYLRWVKRTSSCYATSKWTNWRLFGCIMYPITIVFRRRT